MSVSVCSKKLKIDSFDKSGDSVSLGVDSDQKKYFFNELSVMGKRS